MPVPDVSDEPLPDMPEEPVPEVPEVPLLSEEPLDESDGGVCVVLLDDGLRVESVVPVSLDVPEEPDAPDMPDAPEESDEPVLPVPEYEVWA